VCCGTISSIRDNLIGALADGGWVDMRNLVQIINLMKSHDGFDDWFEPGFTPTAETLQNPLYLLVQIWDVVKDLRWASWLDVPKKRDPENKAKHSGHALEFALKLYGLVTMFHVGEYRDPEDKARAQFRHDREAALALAGVIPALRDFTRYVENLPRTPILGFAVVFKTDRDTVCDTAGGTAIYETEAQAKEVIDYWCTNDHDDAPKPEDFELRPVSVTWDTGLVFTDNKENA
jgi:hypothetical protein